jgi:cystathionine gamma-synthase
VFVRYRQCSANAMAIAKHVEGHPKVERVLYPGLASHPGHAIAVRQMRDGFGGMMSLLVKGGFDDAQKLCTRLKVIVPATSLGGVESLAEHRKTVEGPTSPVPDNLVRLSIGIEHADDLIADLEQALAGI